MIPLYKAQTEWVEPTEFPDLKDAKEIAIDLETKDTELTTRGSGSATNNGEITGIAVAVDGWKGYYPIAHEGGGNMDPKKVIDWFRTILKTEAPKVFHNAMYDVCWIKTLPDMKLNGRIIDTMIAAGIVNENRFKYDLNSLSREYLKEGKNETALREAATMCRC